jgi:hypothetical protein
MVLVYPRPSDFLTYWFSDRFKNNGWMLLWCQCSLTDLKTVAEGCCGVCASLAGLGLCGLRCSWVKQPWRRAEVETEWAKKGRGRKTEGGREGGLCPIGSNLLNLCFEHSLSYSFILAISPVPGLCWSWGEIINQDKTPALSTDDNPVITKTHIENCTHQEG